ncbi:MAG TPA: hypothetical protein VKA25_13355 [Gemmatimonadales bacterium]|nr:hypothetical protein [Gemmatimonadales bacterium]
MDSDAEYPILSHPGIRFPELLLNRYGTFDSIHDARELGQDAIASRIGDPSAVLGYKAIHNGPMSHEGPHRPGFVGMHEPRVVGHVGAEDRRELPFHPFRAAGHGES